MFIQHKIITNNYKMTFSRTTLHQLTGDTSTSDRPPHPLWQARPPQGPHIKSFPLGPFRNGSSFTSNLTMWALLVISWFITFMTPSKYSYNSHKY